METRSSVRSDIRSVFTFGGTPKEQYVARNGFSASLRWKNRKNCKRKI